MSAANAWSRRAGLLLMFLLGNAAMPDGAPGTVPDADPGRDSLAAVMAEDDASRGAIAGWEAELADEGLGDGDRLLLRERIRIRLASVRSRYESLLRAAPDDVRARVAFASFLGETGSDAEAVRHLEEALRIDPRHAPAWNNLANRHGQSGRADQALPAYRKAIELRPDEALYHYNYGTALLLFREAATRHLEADPEQAVRRAVEEYRTALRLEPGNVRYAFDYAQTYYAAPRVEGPARTAQIAEALAAWATVLRMVDNDLDRQGVRLHLARWHLEAGNPEGARTQLVQVTDETLLEARRELERKAGAGSGADHGSAAGPGR